MKTNTKLTHSTFTYEGAKAASISSLQELRRTVMACLLWEKNFYEDGIAVVDRIKNLCDFLTAKEIADLANEAKNVFFMRHVPLLLCVMVIEKKERDISYKCIQDVVQRPDDMGELLSLFILNKGKKVLPKVLKQGLADCWPKFTRYQLQKYKGKGAYTLKDIMRLTHPKPENDEQALLWRQLVKDELPPADTWEVALSAGADKKETFERLLKENQLGYLALLRNLRNMDQSNVDKDLVKSAILARKGAKKILPFSYIAAARHAPTFEQELDIAMQAGLGDLPAFNGETIILVDVSGSMLSPLSSRSEMQRIDAACGVAALFNGKARIFSFSDKVVEIPPRKGMALVDAITNSQPTHGTRLGDAINYVNTLPHDRLIVITDEQSSNYSKPAAPKAYMINVGTYQNGIGYGNGWTANISGFSENIFRYIHSYEIY